MLSVKGVCMPAKVVRVTQREEFVTAMVEADGFRDGKRRVERWHLILRPQKDFNSRPVGYRVWLRRDGKLPESEAAALGSACDLIEQFVAAGDAHPAER